MIREHYDSIKRMWCLCKTEAEKMKDGQLKSLKVKTEAFVLLH